MAGEQLAVRPIPERERRRELIRGCFLEGYEGAALRAEVERRMAGTSEVAAAHVVETLRLQERANRLYPHPAPSFRIDRATGSVIYRPSQTSAPRRHRPAGTSRRVGRPARRRQLVRGSPGRPSEDDPEPPLDLGGAA